MTRPGHHSQPGARGQRGVALIIGLIVIVVLTLLGLAAMRTVGLEERMAGNLRDRSLAFQAGEMGLRYAEQYITKSGLISGITGFDTSCTGGLCYAGIGASLSPALVDSTNALQWNAAYDARKIQFGAVDMSPSYTTPALPSGLPNPTFFIEGFPRMPPGSGDTEYYYRITVRAQGAQPGTIVWLEEVFKP